VWQDITPGNWDIYGEQLVPWVSIKQSQTVALERAVLPTVVSRQRPLAVSEAGWLYTTAGRRAARLQGRSTRPAGLAPGL